MERLNIITSIASFRILKAGLKTIPGNQSKALTAGLQHFQQQAKSKLYLVFILIAFISLYNPVLAQERKPFLHYSLSMPEPVKHTYHLELHSGGWDRDTLHFKIPKWMPGYYQLMDYARSIENVSALDENGRNIPVKKVNGNTWDITGIKHASFVLSYDVKTERQFVAYSYVDSMHAYIVPANTFLYADGFLNSPVSVKVIRNKQWSKTATGLSMAEGKPDEFYAPDFDILYDCPILVGNLEEIPSFMINGIEHRFIGYNMGSFDRKQFMDKLKKVVEAGVAIIGDIPYKEYTFIAIGPGRGGIEHLNNTTISFDGSSLNTAASMNRMMNFLAHEYFHHYNVKRIRPFELGPFDYDKENRTNLLWVSEGLSVYYEYLMVKKAGLMDEKTLLSNLEGNINAVENNPGRLYQSLSQASYYTWSDGPFGKQGKDAGKSISYYDKGPVVGLLLDFTIRNATQNSKSLDDVMRLLYWQYYKKQQRGFTDAEFEEACESVARVSLSRIFEYVYTTKELDYTTYLQYGGLQLDTDTGNNDATKTKKFTLSRLNKPDSLQSVILKSWLGE